MTLYDIFRNLIGYYPTGNYYSWETYYVQGAIAFVLVLTVIFIDLLYRLLRSFIRK